MVLVDHYEYAALSLHLIRSRRAQLTGMATAAGETQRPFATFVQTHGSQHPTSAECLTKDRDAPFAYYDFSVAHWIHFRTINTIEPAFATPRLRNVR